MTRRKNGHANPRWRTAALGGGNGGTTGTHGKRTSYSRSGSIRGENQLRSQVIKRIVIQEGSETERKKNALTRLTQIVEKGLGRRTKSKTGDAERLEGEGGGQRNSSP